MMRVLGWTSVVLSTLAIGAGAPAVVPEKLEDMIAVALRSNPEILTAEAKVRQAEAELNQVRLRVVQDVVTAYHDKQSQARALDIARQQYQEAERLAETGVQPLSARTAAEQLVIAADAKYAQVEAALRYLMGTGEGARPPRPVILQTAAEEKPAPPARPREINAGVAGILEAKITLHFDATILPDVLAALRQLIPSPIIFIDPAIAELGLDEAALQLDLREVPLRAALDAISDLCPDLCFVLRDYGILATTRTRARDIYAPTIPPHVPLNPEVVPPRDMPAK